MDLHHIQMVGRALYYGICAIAILRGDRPLKYVGAAIIGNAVITPLAQAGHVLDGPYFGEMALDIITLVAMAAILVRDRRWWLVVSTACFLMQTLTHIAGLIGPHIPAYTISTARLLWAYGSVFAIAWGWIAFERGRGREGDARTVRTLIAEQGAARAQAELDRRYLTARTPAERAEATRLVETLRQLTDAH